MKKRVVIYGGTELSAAESRFIESFAHALLSIGDVTIVTGGFLYWPEKTPGAISTDYSVLQGAKKYAQEKGVELKEVLETWLPDREIEDDPEKKAVVRFREGLVKELKGETAKARRFSMIRNVDALITVKGKRHTAMVLDFALTMNKPAFPLSFTGGDSAEFWKTNKSRVINWFNLSDELAAEIDTNSMEDWPPDKKAGILEKIVTAVNNGLETELRNQQHYKKIMEDLDEDDVPGKIISEERGGEYVPYKERALDISGTLETVKKKQVNIFLSYSHKDKQLKDELDTSLIALKRDERISVWQDNINIGGGDEWNEEIKEAMERSDIILLLISAEFIKSDYIWKKELPVAQKMQEEGRARVIPIFIRDVFPGDLWFTKLQGYINPGEPIASFKDYDRDTAYRQVVKNLSNDINKWLEKAP